MHEAEESKKYHSLFWFFLVGINPPAENNKHGPNQHGSSKQHDASFSYFL
jgi:hypothetical protein